MRLGRFELPTSCFGGTRSIHLSYSRVVPLYHAALSPCILPRNFEIAIFQCGDEIGLLNLRGVCYSMRSAIIVRPRAFTSMEMGGRMPLPCTISPRTKVLPGNAATFMGSYTVPSQGLTTMG